jgi:hypothetical protein
MLRLRVQVGSHPKREEEANVYYLLNPGASAAVAVSHSYETVTICNHIHSRNSTISSPDILVDDLFVYLSPVDGKIILFVHSHELL